jgi:hypothetical protein
MEIAFKPAALISAATWLDFSIENSVLIHACFIPQMSNYFSFSLSLFSSLSLSLILPLLTSIDISNNNPGTFTGKEFSTALTNTLAIIIF